MILKGLKVVITQYSSGIVSDDMIVQGIAGLLHRKKFDTVCKLVPQYGKETYVYIFTDADIENNESCK